MSDCIFCSIAAHDLPATILREDNEVLAIRDVNPQAPVHVLVMPREHIVSVAELTPAQDHLWGRLLHVAQSIAEDEGIDEKGFRLVVNTGVDGGQTVDHLHMHMLGGRHRTGPPGEVSPKSRAARTPLPV